jgi:hypothetical protein
MIEQTNTGIRALTNDEIVMIAGAGNPKGGHGSGTGGMKGGGDGVDEGGGDGMGWLRRLLPILIFGGPLL